MQTPRRCVPGEPPGADDGADPLAEDAGKVVGYVAVAFDQGPPRGEIYMIAVDPDFQRRGDATSSFQ